MDAKEHTTPEKLELYSFLWSEVRLPVAALALALGGTPPAIYFLSAFGLYNVIGPLLTLAHLLSGTSAGYLLYRWYVGGQKLFGKESVVDKIAFAISTISGIHLGIAGISGVNIGLAVTMSPVVLLSAAVLYLASAFHLYKQWNKAGKTLF